MAASIRLATDTDAAALAAIYAPFYEATHISFEYVATSVEEMARRIRKVTECLPWLVLEDGGSVAGYAYAGAHRERAAYGWAVDAAVYIAPEYRRRGVGRALYTTLFAVLRLQGYFKAYAGVALPNPASTGLHEAVGFTRVGTYRGVGYKQGAWHDVLWYELALQPEQLDPEPPVPIYAVVGSPGWREAVTMGLAHFRSDPTGSEP
jgi:phosphinothricin acetyltransferase